MQFAFRSGLAAAMLLTLAACGGGGGDTSATPNTTGVPSTSAAPPTTSASGSPQVGAAAPVAATVDATCGLANFDADALRLINARRAAGATCGAQGTFAAAPPLVSRPELVTAAYGHSKDMADNNYFSHTSLDGRTLGPRITAAGYGWSLIGENIAAGYTTVGQTVDAWMASDGHCANLMNPNFSDFGLACARNAASQYGSYWTIDLGRP
jgi:uncharacterized protein YkwD